MDVCKVGNLELMCSVPRVFRLIGNKVIDLLYLKLGGQGGPSAFIIIYIFMDSTILMKLFTFLRASRFTFQNSEIPLLTLAYQQCM